MPRQYNGTAGRIENCQIGVFLGYATAQGRVLLDRELYLPQVWAGDEARRREAGVPGEVTFRTKPQLAQGMVERAVEGGVPVRWFAGDTVYGSDRKLPRWLEQREIPHVLAIKSNEKLWVWTEVPNWYHSSKPAKSPSSPRMLSWLRHLVRSSRS